MFDFVSIYLLLLGLPFDRRRRLRSLHRRMVGSAATAGCNLGSGPLHPWMERASTSGLMRVGAARVSVQRMTALRGRVAPADIAIAAAVTAALELDAWGQHIRPHTASAPAFAVVGASLLFRRNAPLPVLVVGLAALLVGVFAGVSMEKPVTPLLFYALVLYAVGLREELRRAPAGLVVALA